VSEDVHEAEEELAIAEELAEELGGDTEVLAAIVGDEFALEMISPWGDRWIWVKIDANQAQEIYKLLGEPVFQQAELTDEQDKPPAMPEGDDPRAGHPIKPLL
jgi:hypothetical protein